MCFRSKEKVIKNKDEILNQKENILKEKTNLISENDAKISQFQNEVKTHLLTIEKQTKRTNDVIAQLTETKELVAEIENQVPLPELFCN